MGKSLDGKMGRERSGGERNGNGNGNGERDRGRGEGGPTGNETGVKEGDLLGLNMNDEEAGMEDVSSLGTSPKRHSQDPIEDAEEFQARKQDHQKADSERTPLLSNPLGDENSTLEQGQGAGAGAGVGGSSGSSNQHYQQYHQSNKSNSLVRRNSKPSSNSNSNLNSIRDRKGHTGFATRPGGTSHPPSGGNSSSSSSGIRRTHSRSSIHSRDGLDSGDEDDDEDEEWLPDLFVFEYGTVVMWGMTEKEEKRVLANLSVWLRVIKDFF